MSTNKNDELIIPEVLLELQGIGTEPETVFSDVEMKAIRLASQGKIVEAERIVEAGFAELLMNMFRKTLKPQEIEALISQLGTKLNRPTNAEFYNNIVPLLENLSKSQSNAWNSFIPKKFVRTEMTPELMRIQEILRTRPNIGQHEADEIAGLLGKGVKNSVEAITSPTGLFKNLKQKISNPTLLQKQIMGLEKDGKPVTLEQFLSEGMNIGSATATTPTIQITNQAALSSELSTIAQQLATKAGNKQIVEALSMLSKGIAAGFFFGVPLAGIHQMRKVSPEAPQINSTDKVVGKDGMHTDALPSNPLNKNPLGDSSKNSPMGGTTNGSNFGNFGGQFNQGWMPPQPNLPNNSKDWLPTNTTDYYDAIRKSDDNHNENIRLASNVQQLLLDFPDIDDVVTRLFTILEQGTPGEETFQSAMGYINSLNKQAEPILNAYRQNPLSFVAPNQENDNHLEK